MAETILTTQGETVDLTEVRKKGAAYDVDVAADPIQCGKKSTFPTFTIYRVALGFDLSAWGGVAPDIVSAIIEFTAIAKPNDPNLELRAAGYESPNTFTPLGLFDACGDGEMQDSWPLAVGPNAHALSEGSIDKLRVGAAWGYVLFGVTNSRVDDLVLHAPFTVDRAVGFTITATLQSGQRVFLHGNVGGNVGGHV